MIPATKLVTYTKGVTIKQSRDCYFQGAISQPEKQIDGYNLHRIKLTYPGFFDSTPYSSVHIIGLHHDKDHNLLYQVPHAIVGSIDEVMFTILLHPSTKGVMLQLRSIGHMPENHIPTNSDSGIQVLGRPVYP
jgi:hypothetical protein